MLEIGFWYCPQLIVLVLSRVAAVLMTFNFLGWSGVPQVFKVAVALMVTLALMPVVPVEWAVAARKLDTMPALVIAGLSEILTGVAIGLVCQLFLAACRMGGYLIGFSNSLMMAQQVDPGSGVSSNAISGIVQSLFVLLFFLTNGHLVLFQQLAGSFHDLPLFSLSTLTDSFGGIVAMGARMFEWGLKIAMPVLAVGLLLDVSMGLVSRLAPEFEIMFLSLPIRLFAGLATFGLVLATSGDLFQGMIEEMLSGMMRMMGRS
jgi:flagellar biosynthetic protein FliR